MRAARARSLSGSARTAASAASGASARRLGGDHRPVVVPNRQKIIREGRHRIRDDLGRSGRSVTSLEEMAELRLTSACSPDDSGQSIPAAASRDTGSSRTARKETSRCEPVEIPSNASPSTGKTKPPRRASSLGISCHVTCDDRGLHVPQYVAGAPARMCHMPRPPSFDRHAAVVAAKEVFWHKGYQGAAISDLLGATGLSRSSLYGAFETKGQLFEAALDEYEHSFIDLMLGPVEADRAGLDEAAGFFLALAPSSATPPGSKGAWRSTASPNWPGAIPRSRVGDSGSSAGTAWHSPTPAQPRSPMVGWGQRDAVRRAHLLSATALGPGSSPALITEPPRRCAGPSYPRSTPGHRPAQVVLPRAANPDGLAGPAAAS